MAKRFTETNKWIDPWFRKLNIKGKLFWLFILDNCDAAGFWKYDMELFSFFIGESNTLEEMIKVINNGKERVKVVKDRIFIMGFAEFQYGSFRESKHPFHKKLVNMIDYPYGINGVSYTPQDKDKDKDKDKDSEGDIKGDEYSAEFEEFWSLYPRKAGKGAASKAFKAQKCKDLMDVIKKAIGEQKISDQWQKDGGQFIPHPTTWINQKRWCDSQMIETVKRRSILDE